MEGLETAGREGPGGGWFQLPGEKIRRVVVTARELWYSATMAELIQVAITELRGKGWTLTALGDALGTTRNTIDRWQQGIHTPANTTLVLAALQELLKRRRIPKQRRHTTTKA